MPQPTLETKRLILRPFRLNDAPAVQELAGERDIADTTMNIPHPYEDGMAEDWIGGHEPGYEDEKIATFAIVLRDCAELVGAIGLQIDRGLNKAELGYWIGKPFWNLGYYRLDSSWNRTDTVCSRSARIFRRLFCSLLSKTSMASTNWPSDRSRLRPTLGCGTSGKSNLERARGPPTSPESLASSMEAATRNV